MSFLFVLCGLAVVMFVVLCLRMSLTTPPATRRVSVYQPLPITDDVHRWKVLDTTLPMFMKRPAYADTQKLYAQMHNVLRTLDECCLVSHVMSGKGWSNPSFLYSLLDTSFLACLLTPVGGSSGVMRFGCNDPHHRRVIRARRAHDPTLHTFTVDMCTRTRAIVGIRVGGRTSTVRDAHWDDHCLVARRGIEVLALHWMAALYRCLSAVYVASEQLLPRAHPLARWLTETLRPYATHAARVQSRLVSTSDPVLTRLVETLSRSILHRFACSSIMRTLSRRKRHAGGVPFVCETVRRSLCASCVSESAHVMQWKDALVGDRGHMIRWEDVVRAAAASQLAVRSLSKMLLVCALTPWSLDPKSSKASAGAVAEVACPPAVIERACAAYMLHCLSPHGGQLHGMLRMLPFDQSRDMQYELSVESALGAYNEWELREDTVCQSDVTRMSGVMGCGRTIEHRDGTQHFSPALVTTAVHEETDSDSSGDSDSLSDDESAVE
jgi:hypothetical protein